MRSHLYILLIYILVHPINVQSQVWDIRDVGEGIKPAITTGPDGSLHIAYMNEANAGFIKHTIVNGESYDTETIGTGYYYGPLDIGISGNGTVYIAVHDHFSENELVFTLFNNTWFRDQVVHSGHDGWDNSITFDSKGNIHTSSTDPFGNIGVEYAWKDQTGWKKESIGSGPVTYGWSTSIALDSEDNVNIAYYKPQQKQLMLGTRAPGGGWLRGSIATDEGMFPVLDFDSDDIPHIIYFAQG